MASVFTKVRTQELPGNILYQDEDVFAILTIAPHAPGHLLVIPVEEYSDLLNTPKEIRAHLMAISHWLMGVTKALYDPPRVAMVVAGLEENHAHIHIFSLFTNDALDHGAILSTDEATRSTEASKITNYILEHPFK